MYTILILLFAIPILIHYIFSFRNITITVTVYSSY